MLELLFDEVEAGSITKLGVDESNDWYRRSVALLKERVEVRNWPKFGLKFGLHRPMSTYNWSRLLGISLN